MKAPEKSLKFAQYEQIMTATQLTFSFSKSVNTIVNFEHISHLFLVFLLLTLNK